ncbi:MAG: LysR family transcriptional regulator [Polyangiaceae bacterium]
MRLDALRALLDVIDHGSFFAASKATGVPHATLRLRVTALEQDLGVSLLVSTHRGVQATEPGLRFAARARALVEEADALRRDTIASQQEVVGELRIRSSVGFPREMIGVFASAVRHRHPDLVQWSELTRDPIRDLSPDIDLVIHFGHAKPDGPFRTVALRRFREVPMASAGYLTARGRPTTVEELAKHDLLSWMGPGEDGRCWPLLDGSNLPVSPWFLSSDPLLVRTLVAAGQGIALLPDDELSRDVLPGGRLEAILSDRIGRQSAVWLLIPETTTKTPRGRVIIEMMREMAQGMFGVTLDLG